MNSKFGGAPNAARRKSLKYQQPGKTGDGEVQWAALALDHPSALK